MRVLCNGMIRAMPARHRNADDLVPAERFDGDDRGERRINSAGQSKHHA